jgi:hypothetical protein
MELPPSGFFEYRTQDWFLGVGPHGVVVLDNNHGKYIYALEWKNVYWKTAPDQFIIMTQKGDKLKEIVLISPQAAIVANLCKHVKYKWAKESGALPKKGDTTRIQIQKSQQSVSSPKSSKKNVLQASIDSLGRSLDVLKSSKEKVYIQEEPAVLNDKEIRELLPDTVLPENYVVPSVGIIGRQKKDSKNKKYNDINIVMQNRKNKRYLMLTQRASKMELMSKTEPTKENGANITSKDQFQPQAQKPSNQSDANALQDEKSGKHKHISISQVKVVNLSSPEKEHGIPKSHIIDIESPKGQQIAIVISPEAVDGSVQIDLHVQSPKTGALQEKRPGIRNSAVTTSATNYPEAPVLPIAVTSHSIGAELARKNSARAKKTTHAKSPFESNIPCDTSPTLQEKHLSPPDPVVSGQAGENQPSPSSQRSKPKLPETGRNNAHSSPKATPKFKNPNAINKSSKGSFGKGTANESNLLAELDQAMQGEQTGAIEAALNSNQRDTTQTEYQSKIMVDSQKPSSQLNKEHENGQLARQSQISESPSQNRNRFNSENPSRLLLDNRQRQSSEPVTGKSRPASMVLADLNLGTHYQPRQSGAKEKLNKNQRVEIKKRSELQFSFDASGVGPVQIVDKRK